MSWWAQIGHMDIPCDSGEYIQFRNMGKYKQLCQLSVDITHLVVGLEATFVVLTQIKPLKSWHYIVHYVSAHHPQDELPLTQSD